MKTNLMKLMLAATVGLGVTSAYAQTPDDAAMDWDVQAQEAIASWNAEFEDLLFFAAQPLPDDEQLDEAPARRGRALPPDVQERMRQRLRDARPDEGRFADIPPEARQRLRKYAENMSPEERQQLRRRLQQMEPEQRRDLMQRLQQGERPRRPMDRQQAERGPRPGQRGNAAPRDMQRVPPQLRERLQNLSPEQRQRLRDRVEQMSPEQRREFMQRFRDEQRQQPPKRGRQFDDRRPRAQQGMNRVPPQLRERLQNLSPEQRQRLRDRVRQMDPEHRRELLQRFRDGDRPMQGRRPMPQWDDQAYGPRGQRGRQFQGRMMDRPDAWPEAMPRRGRLNQPDDRAFGRRSFDRNEFFRGQMPAPRDFRGEQPYRRQAPDGEPMICPHCHRAIPPRPQRNRR
jgi:hypothetical protein